MNRLEENLGLVRKIAYRYAKKTRHEYDDLFQEGSLALWKASQDYIECDVPFGAFAAQRINFAIMNYMRDTNVFKISARIVAISMFIKKRGLQEEPVSDIKKLVNDSEKSIELALEHLKNEVLSLDYEYSTKDKKETLSDFIKIFDNESDYALYSLFLDTLNNRDRFIFEKWNQGYTQKEIANMMGSSRDGVSNFMLRVRKHNQELKKELKGEYK